MEDNCQAGAEGDSAHKSQKHVDTLSHIQVS